MLRSTQAERRAPGKAAIFSRPMSDLRVEAIRGPAVESVHRVSAVVADANGRTIAVAGDPALVTFWRSAAKPFQALPLVEDGVLDRFGLGSDALALACASHSSEPQHLAVTDRMLAAIGCTEADLACGPHPPLGDAGRARSGGPGDPYDPALEQLLRQARRDARARQAPRVADRGI